MTSKTIFIDRFVSNKTPTLGETFVLNFLKYSILDLGIHNRYQFTNQ
jgi:hypothetical protein